MINYTQLCKSSPEHTKLKPATHFYLKLKLYSLISNSNYTTTHYFLISNSLFHLKLYLLSWLIPELSLLSWAIHLIVEDPWPKTHGEKL